VLNLPLPDIHPETDKQYAQGCLMVVEGGHPRGVDVSSATAATCAGKQAAQRGAAMNSATAHSLDRHEDAAEDAFRTI
jgi:hypothetical protein